MRRSTGFSMVEVLVSIVILSIALLGTAGLMSASLRNTNTAYYRSQATVLADDILDRMRSNPTSARASEYDMDPGPSGHSFSAPSGSMAEFDVTEWTTTLADVLPGGEATIRADNNSAVVTITWDAGESSFTTQSIL